MRTLSAITVSLVAVAGIAAICGSKAIGRMLSFADPKAGATPAPAFSDAHMRSGVAANGREGRANQEAYALTPDTRREEPTSPGDEYATILGFAEDAAGDASGAIALGGGFAGLPFDASAYADMERAFGAATTQVVLIGSLRDEELVLPAVQSLRDGLFTSGFLPAVQRGKDRASRSSASVGNLGDAGHAGDAAVLPVPEPGSLALVAAGTLLILSRRPGGG